MTAVDSMSSTLHIFIVYASFGCLAYGQPFSFGPGYRASGRQCEFDHDCERFGMGEICWRWYDGCSQGHCMCAPRTHALDATGRCVQVKRSNEDCTTNDTCAESLACINGTCQCPHVNHQDSAHSGSLCIPPNYKFIGRPCNPSTDVCYHESTYGYTTNEAECSSRSGLCQCKEGYKRDRRTCRHLHIWEIGCRRDYNCEGGAVCVDEQCACPTGYKSVAGNTKCAKRDARLELPLGYRCDEINEKEYCAYGLVCHTCRENEPHPICAKYLSGFEKEPEALKNLASLAIATHHASILIACILAGFISQLDR